MQKKRAIIFGASGGAAVAAIAGVAFALAPAHRGLAALDLDGDGRIVTAEIQQGARQRFAALDRNGDGQLTREELPRGRHGLGHGRRHRHDGSVPDAAPPAVPAQPRRGFAAADADGDGALSLREFYAQLSARAARADANRDGTISAEELAAHRDRGPRRRR